MLLLYITISYYLCKFCMSMKLKKKKVLIYQYRVSYIFIFINSDFKLL